MKIRTDFVTNSSSSSYTVTISLQLKDGKIISYEGTACEENDTYMPNEPASPQEIAEASSVEELKRLLESYSSIDESFGEGIEAKIQSPDDIVAVTISSEGENGDEFLNEEYCYNKKDKKSTSTWDSSTGEDDIDCGDDSLSIQFQFTTPKAINTSNAVSIQSNAESAIASEILCPRCKIGHLLVRKNESKNKYFVGCSHYPSCTYTVNDTSIMNDPRICPICGGFLVRRKSRYDGSFYGCTNYPHCNYTEQIRIRTEGDDSFTKSSAGTVQKDSSVIKKANTDVSVVSSPFQATVEDGVLKTAENAVGDVVVPDGVKVIEDKAFADCTELTSVTLPDGVISIGDYAFRNAKKLRSFNFPASLRLIYKKSFQNVKLFPLLKENNACYMAVGENPHYILLEMIDPSETSCVIHPDTKLIAGRAFEKAAITSVVLPEGLLGIGEYAFDACAALTTLSIPNSVDTIGKCCFRRCKGMTDLKLSESLTDLPDECIRECKKLKEIHIPESVLTIGNGAIQDCRITGITLPAGLQTVHYDFAYKCDKLVEVKIPAGCRVVDYLGNDTEKTSQRTDHTGIPFVFAGDVRSKKTLSDSEIENSSGSRTSSASKTAFPDFEIENGILKKYKGPGGDVVIPDGVTEIAPESFDCCAITRLVIPNGVRTIGYYVFMNCSSMTEITIPDSVTEIGNGAFFGCSALKRIVIPKGVKVLGECTFDGCKALADVTLYGVEELGDYCFHQCDSLIEFELPGTMKKMGNSVFWECKFLEAVFIPESVKEIDERGLFLDCAKNPIILTPAGSFAQRYAEENSYRVKYENANSLAEYHRQKAEKAEEARRTEEARKAEKARKAEIARQRREAYDALIREREEQRRIIAENKGLFKGGVRKAAQRRIDEIEAELRNYPEFQ